MPIIFFCSSLLFEFCSGPTHCWCDHPREVEGYKGREVQPPLLTKERRKGQGLSYLMSPGSLHCPLGDGSDLVYGSVMQKRCAMTQGWQPSPPGEPVVWYSSRRTEKSGSAELMPSQSHTVTTTSLAVSLKRLLHHSQTGELDRWLLRLSAMKSRSCALTETPFGG